MGCHWVKTADGGVVHVSIRERKRRCVACGQLGAERLCDGKKPEKKSGTCDAPVCGRCAFSAGKDVDYCPACRAGIEARTMGNRPPPDVKVAMCRSCGAEIIWAKMHTGNLNPVDSLPTDNGNIVLSKSKVSGEVKGESYDANHHAGRKRYVSHFATCKHAAQHRKPKETQLALDVTGGGKP